MSLPTPSTRVVVPLDGSEFATRAIPANTDVTEELIVDELASISDPVHVAAGLAERPPLVLLAGAERYRNLFAPEVIRALLRTLVVPVLLVPVGVANATAVVDATEADVERSEA